MNKSIILALGLTASLFASCKKDDDKPSDNQKIPYTTLTSTSSYFATFPGPDSATSVDISGQQTRISMLKEMDAYMRLATTSVVDAAKLRNMYRNLNAPFNSAALNAATDKTLISKTAQSFPAADAATERDRFDGFFDALAATSAFHNQVASQGSAGLLDAKYLVDAKGFEYGQFVQKGMMGALMLDQISNIYLGTEKQGADNSVLVTGKNYTAMEHHWDEAYGYLTGNAYFPMKDPADATKWLESYLGSYVRQVGAPYGNPTEVYLSFLHGRAAIVNNDMNTKNTQIANIRVALEKAVATIAVSYLNKSKT
ncbi:MAG: DUF4856 domain-containing protein, partial [Sphingobacteriales bacterium]